MPIMALTSFMLLLMHRFITVLDSEKPSNMKIYIYEQQNKKANLCRIIDKWLTE